MREETKRIVVAKSCENYEFLRKNMLFACMWRERKTGGYIISDWHPFVALRKRINQGVEAFEGVHLDISNYEVREVDGKEFMFHKIVVKDNDAGIDGLYNSYRPAARLFPEEEPGRLIIMDDLDELCNLFISRSSHRINPVG